MRSVLLLGIVLLAGCQGTTGPFAKPTGKVDQPLYNIEMQKQRARERSMPIDDPNITPNTDSAQYGPSTGPPNGRP